MKKNIYYFGLFIITLMLFNSCNSDDNSSPSLSENAVKLIGTWGTEWDDGTGISIHPKFTFKNNGDVKYYTYSGNQPELEETGTWELNDDILTMEFPQTVLIKFKNIIIFNSDTEINFEEIQESGFDTWSASTYYKTDEPNL